MLIYYSSTFLSRSHHDIIVQVSTVTALYTHFAASGVLRSHDIAATLPPSPEAFHLSSPLLFSSIESPRPSAVRQKKRRMYGETSKTNQTQPNPPSTKLIPSSSSRYHHNHHHHHPIPVFINPPTHSLAHSLTFRETTSTKNSRGQGGPFCIQGHICFGPFQLPYLVQQPERDVGERKKTLFHKFPTGKSR